MKTISIILIMLAIQFLIETFVLDANAVLNTSQSNSTSVPADSSKKKEAVATTTSNSVAAKSSSTTLGTTVKDLKGQCIVEGKKGAEIPDCVKEKSK